MKLKVCASLAAVVGLILSFTFQEQSRDGPKKENEEPALVEPTEEILEEGGQSSPKPEPKEESQPKPSDKDLREFRSRLVSIQEALESQREILSGIQERQETEHPSPEDSRIQGLIEEMRVLKYAVDGIYDRLESQDYEALERALVQIAGRLYALVEETEGREPGVSLADLADLETRLEERFEEILAKIPKTQSQELAQKPQGNQQEQRKEEEQERVNPKGLEDFDSWEEYERYLLRPPDSSDRTVTVKVSVTNSSQVYRLGLNPREANRTFTDIPAREVDGGLIFWIEEKEEWRSWPSPEFTVQLIKN